VFDFVGGAGFVGGTGACRSLRSPLTAAPQRHNSGAVLTQWVHPEGQIVTHKALVGAAAVDNGFNALVADPTTQ